MWYMGHAKGEVTKPLQFWNETLLILTYLSVQGTTIKIQYILLAYLILFIFMVAIGKLIVKMGVVNYNTQLGNSQNPELLKILHIVQKLEKDINDIRNKIANHG
jgi:hypothetical protein